LEEFSIYRRRAVGSSEVFPKIGMKTEPELFRDITEPGEDIVKQCGDDCGDIQVFKKEKNL
jgi:hypothetical protein